jgi:hypothetical protein
VKINRDDLGKKRGSGKSKVVTHAVYLGSAEKILGLVQEKREPLSVSTRRFGLIAAAYQTASQIGLQEILSRRLPGDRAGVERWIYFFQMVKRSAYGSCLNLSVRSGELRIDENTQEIEERKKRFGKSLIFSDMLGAETGYLIDTYNHKNAIESDFQLLKDQAIIRFRPIRHWTDSKIRAYAFCCVVSMTLMRVMQWKARNAGYAMSPHVLKEELSDIREVAMVYSPSDVRTKITDRSAVQNKLWEAFKLGDVEQHLYIH